MMFLDDARSFQPGDILLNLALGYNLVMHFPAIIINMTIFAKEFSMYFFEFLHAGWGSDAKYAMRPKDIITSWGEVIDSLDPLFWIDLFAGSHLETQYEGNFHQWLNPLSFLV